MVSHKEKFWLRFDKKPNRRKSGTHVKTEPKKTQKENHRHNKGYKPNKYLLKKYPGRYDNCRIYEEDEQMLYLTSFHY